MAGHECEHAPFSVCIIARNEEENLARCLAALAPLRAEIIVTDTGSTDRTAEIAREAGATVVSFEWTDDFSAARNFAASRASHDYILAVDADEFLDASCTDMAGLLKQIGAHPDAVGMIERISPTVREGESKSVREHVARFYDRTRFCYHGTIHENIGPRDAASPLSFYELPLTFLHGGYETAELVVRKANRDLALLLRALETEEDKPYLHYQTGKCYVALQDREQAIVHYEKALSLKPDDRLSYVQDMAESYGYCLLETGNPAGALAFLEGLPDHFSKHADFCFLLGLVYMNNARFPEAVEAFERATQCETCSVDGCDSYRAYYNMGVILEVTGNTGDAIRCYQKCGAYGPAEQRLTALR